MLPISQMLRNMRRNRIQPALVTVIEQPSLYYAHGTDVTQTVITQELYHFPISTEMKKPRSSYGDPEQNACYSWWRMEDDAWEDPEDIETAIDALGRFEVLVDHSKRERKPNLNSHID